MKKIILLISTLFFFLTSYAQEFLGGPFRSIEVIIMCDNNGGTFTPFYRVQAYQIGLTTAFTINNFDRNSNPYTPTGIISFGVCDSTSAALDFEVSEKCDIITKTLTIQGTAVTSGDSITFTNTSVYPSGDQLSNYYIDFGDGTTSAVGVPLIKVYRGLPDGVYTARLVVEMQSGNTNHVNWLVTVRSDSVISVSSDPSTGWGYTVNENFYEFRTSSGALLITLDEDGNTYVPVSPGECRNPVRLIPPLSLYPGTSVNFSELCSNGFIDTILPGDSVDISAPATFCPAQVFTIVCDDQTQKMEVILTYGTYTTAGIGFIGNRTTFLTLYSPEYSEWWDVVKITGVKIINRGLVSVSCTYKLSTEFRKYKK